MLVRQQFNQVRLTLLLSLAESSLSESFCVCSAQTREESIEPIVKSISILSNWLSVWSECLLHYINDSVFNRSHFPVSYGSSYGSIRLNCCIRNVSFSQLCASVHRRADWATLSSLLCLVLSNVKGMESFIWVPFYCTGSEPLQGSASQAMLISLLQLDLERGEISSDADDTLCTCQDAGISEY